MQVVSETSQISRLVGGRALASLLGSEAPALRCGVILHSDDTATIRLPLELVENFEAMLVNLQRSDS
jgi:hypothetical protein